MRIAVCDDSREDAVHLKSGLEKIWPDAQIDIYDGAGEVLAAMEGEKACDLVFFDICLDGMSGIQAAGILRKSWPDTECVFISTSREYGPEAYELNALYYLVKPYKEELLEEIRNRYRKKHVAGVMIYNSIARQKQEVPFHSITYVESARNDLYIHLTGGPKSRSGTVCRTLQRNWMNGFSG